MILLLLGTGVVRWGFPNRLWKTMFFGFGELFHDLSQGIPLLANKPQNLFLVIMPVFPKDEIKMIAFDVDGTLFSSEGIILSVYTQAIQEYTQNSGKALETPTRDEILLQLGKPVKEIFQNLLPYLEEHERDGISQRVLDLLCDSVRTGGGDFYAGVGSTIHYLKSTGYTISCASNGRRPYIETVLGTAGVLSFFEPLVVVNESSIRTKTDILAEYIRKYSLPGHAIAMIGDRYSDWEAARENGCRFAYCDYGHAPVGEVPDFEWKLQRLDEMKTIF